MMYLIDKRTGFYYTARHEAFVGESEEDFPAKIRNDPNVYPEEFNDEDETALFTDMFNSGINIVRIGLRPYKIEIEDIEHLSPNYMEYYLSNLKLGDDKYKSLLWKEKAYFIVKLGNEPEFLITNVNNETYYVIFASKIDADDFLRNSSDYSGFETALYTLDRNLKYCLLGCNTTVFLNWRKDSKGEQS